MMFLKLVVTAENILCIFMCSSLKELLEESHKEVKLFFGEGNTGIPCVFPSRKKRKQATSRL